VNENMSLLRPTYKMQQDTNTITQSVIDYFNISKFCMHKVTKFAMKFGY